MDRRTVLLAPLLLIALTGCVFLPGIGDGDANGTNNESDIDDVDTEDDVTVSAEEGSLENPYALGTRIEDSGWAFTVLHIGHNEDAEIQSHNPIAIQEAPEGHSFSLINVHIENLSDAPEQPAASLFFAYFTDGGEQLSPHDFQINAPSEIQLFTEIEPGHEATGNIPLIVPDDDVGVFAVYFEDSGLRAHWAL